VYQDPEDKSFLRHVTFVSRSCEGSECQDDAAACNLIDTYRCFGGTCCLILQSRKMSGTWRKVRLWGKGEPELAVNQVLFVNIKY
jgi:hypothetical protein